MDDYSRVLDKLSKISATVAGIDEKITTITRHYATKVSVMEDISTAIQNHKNSSTNIAIPPPRTRWDKAVIPLITAISGSITAIVAYFIGSAS